MVHSGLRVAGPSFDVFDVGLQRINFGKTIAKVVSPQVVVPLSAYRFIGHDWITKLVFRENSLEAKNAWPPAAKKNEVAVAADAAVKTDIPDVSGLSMFCDVISIRPPQPCSAPSSSIPVVTRSLLVEF